MLRALLRTREARTVLLADAATAAVCAFLPLADHLGFELAAVLTIVNAMVAPLVGFAAMRVELAREREQWRTARAAAVAGLFAAGALVVPALVILLNGVRRPTCEPSAGALWLLVLPAPTAWLAATTGAVARLYARSLPRTSARATRWAVAGVAVVELASLLASVAPVYWGPAFFVLDHFFGYFPGPLYDQSVLLTPALLLFRATTVLWGAAAVTAAGALGGGEGATRATRRMHTVWAVVLATTLVAVSVVWSTDLGWRTTDGSLARALGGEVRVDAGGAALVIHFPREWPDQSVEELVRDAAFDLTDLERVLGVRPSAPVRVWMYRSTAEKRRLVGAAGTSFAKPWRREVHVNPEGFPHVSLRHELVHVLGAGIAGGPFGVPGGLVPNNALIEGFAVAYEIDDEGLTLAQWARAMRDLRLAPDLGRVLSRSGFLAAAPQRAYTYVGAFIRFLDARYGRAAVQALYRSGDLGAMGQSETLVRDFERSLDSVAVDAEARATAARRFARPSLFRQRCGREASRLVEAARALVVDRRWSEALATYERAAALQPDDPAIVRGELSAALRAGEAKVVAASGVDTARVRAIAERLWRHPRLDPALDAASRLDVGDDRWRRGDLAGARALYERAGTLPVDPPTHRAVTVRLRALADSGLTSLLEPFLAEGDAELAQLFRMADTLSTRPGDPLVAYLLGRQLVLRHAGEKGAALLERAVVAGLGDRELSREALRSLVRAYAERHRCDDAERTRPRLRAASGSAADDMVAADWVGRCRFEAARGWAPLSR